MISLQRAVPGTSRVDQMRAIAVREARARSIWLEVFQAWGRILNFETLKDARRGGGFDVALFGNLFDLEMARREDQLVRALTGPIVRQDLDNFTTGLGPLTIETLARKQIGRLVVELSRGQRRALREQLVLLFAEGPTDEILLGISSATGLTARQARSVQNLRRRLIQDGVPSGSAVRRAQDHARRLLRRRARLIARTESVRFTALLVDERGAQVSGMVKQWVSARDGNVDDICISLDNGQRVPSPRGRFSGSSGQISRPPAHPGCRCVIELSKTKPGPGRKTPKRRPPRIRPPPVTEPPPPRPPPPPTGEARTAAQAGAELEEVTARTSSLVARVASQRDEVLGRLTPIQTRLNKIIDQKAVLRREAGIGPFAQVPDELFNSPAWKRLTLEGLQLDRQANSLAARIDASGQRLSRVGRAGRNLRRAVIRRPVSERNLGNFVNRANNKPRPNPIPVPGAKPLPSRRAVREQGIDDFRELVSKRWLTAPDGQPIRVTLVSSSTRRSYMDHGKLVMSPNAPGSTVVHEAGHVVEWFHPEVLQSSLRFWERRTAGETSSRLSIFSPGRGYKAYEITRKDAFIDPYVGKDYAGAYTEIFSMGIEYMSKDPLEFWRRDPDHFTYIWDIMRGIVPQ